MEIGYFWKIVGDVKTKAGSNVSERPKILEEMLATLSADSIQGFNNTYDSLLQKAYRWDLWGAAYLMKGGCSDDGFHYFRDWLISEGQSIYEAAVQNSESLAVYPKTADFELESYGYAAHYAFQRVGAGELEGSFEAGPRAPAGTEWREEDLPKILPKIYAKFL